MDLIDLFDRATMWTKSKISGAAGNLAAATPCEDWDARALINHCVSVQRMFIGAARGDQPSGPPVGGPPDVIGDDPAQQYEEARQATLEAFREEGALERGGSTLGIGFVDQLIHGWDLAKATGQDTTMPADLAEVAYSFVEGRMPDEKSRGPFFKLPVDVPADASAQDKLVAYSGRQP